LTLAGVLACCGSIDGLFRCVRIIRVLATVFILDDPETAPLPSTNDSHSADVVITETSDSMPAWTQLVTAGANLAYSSLHLVINQCIKFIDDAFGSLLIYLGVLEDGFTEGRPDRLQHVRVEVQVRVLAKVASTEGALECETVQNLKLFPTHHSRCRLLRLLNRKCAVAEVECAGGLLKQEREYLLLVRGVAFQGITIHEHVFLARMAVKITKQNQLSFFLHLLEQHLDAVNCRMHFLRRIHPDTIQVYSCQ